MLLGGNGSGKTSLMSQLHPFRESFDERKKLVLEGKDGLKEIDIKHGDDFYQIRHLYGNKSQSFIKKNGKELNENGGVRTFAEIVSKELSITPDYFKIGKIGSNTVNFIDLTASERKNFISKFLPDIEDYLEKFKIVKDKFKLLSSNIKSVSNDVSNSTSKDELEAKIKLLESSLSNVESMLEEEIKKLAIADSVINGTNITEILEALKENEEAQTEKTNRKNEIALIGKSFVSKYENNYSLQDLRNEVAKLTEEINTLNIKISEISSKRLALHDKIIYLEEEILKKEDKVKDFDASELDRTIAEINEANKTISDSSTEREKLISEMNISEADIESIPLAISNFKKFEAFITSEFNNLQESIDGKKILDCVETSFRNIFSAKINSAQALVHQKDEKVKILNVHLAGLMANISKWEILQKRPKSCADDTCPFIKDALKYKNLKEDIEKTETEINEGKKEYEIAKISLTQLEDIESIYKQYISLYTSLNISSNIIFRNIEGKFSNFVGTSLNDFSQECQKIYDRLETIITLTNDIREKTKEVEILSYKKTSLENISKMTTDIMNSINEEKALKALEEEKQLELEKEFLIASTELDALNIRLKDFSDFAAGKSEFNSLKTQICELNKTIEELNEKKTLYENSKTSFSDINDKITGLKNKKTSTNALISENRSALSRIIELSEKLEKLNKEYTSMKLIRDSLDPNKGIPLYFIKSYLEKIKDTTNDLLKIAFNDNFEIDFETDANNFFIKVRVGDSIKNDIKEASQGEVALTTVSISLALIEQSIAGYNILCLDEIDGPLDASNRVNFINMLNKQIKKLNIEQVFIISHNNAFDTCPANLILLKNHNVDVSDEAFMKNKTLIFKA